MGTRKEFWCDICDKVFEFGAPYNLVGLRFTNTSDFVLDSADTTDGKHICQSCLKSIVAQGPQHFKSA